MYQTLVKYNYYHLMLVEPIILVIVCMNSLNRHECMHGLLRYCVPGRNVNGLPSSWGTTCTCVLY